ncbi:Lrp/AsnC family transcriptional regulator [Cohaesibacter celericrescens]|uniref:Lrp/AsnC family transcriptional regulator n=1 Tax=Cohaesibacter celericrescens TaxID=2067669 RepID=UPI0035661A2D
MSTGYRALQVPDLVGRIHVAIVHISLEKTRGNIREDFNKQATAMSEVETCLMIAGNFNDMPKIHTKDIEHFRSVLTDKIGNLPSATMFDVFGFVAQLARYK